MFLNTVIVMLLQLLNNAEVWITIITVIGCDCYPEYCDIHRIPGADKS